MTESWNGSYVPVLMGDCAAHRALAVLLKKRGRHAISMGELYDAAEAECYEGRAEIVDHLNKMIRIGAVEQPKHGMVRLDMSSPVSRSFVDLDVELVREQHPESVF